MLSRNVFSVIMFFALARDHCNATLTTERLLYLFWIGIPIPAQRLISLGPFCPLIFK